MEYNTTSRTPIKDVVISTIVEHPQEDKPDETTNIYSSKNSATNSTPSRNLAQFSSPSSMLNQNLDLIR